MLTGWSQSRIVLACVEVSVHQTPFLCLLKIEGRLCEARLVKDVLLQEFGEGLVLQGSWEQSHDGVQLIVVLPSFPELYRRREVLQLLEQILLDPSATVSTARKPSHFASFFSNIAIHHVMSRNTRDM
jgi:hypothetical protein